jgi:hypothetical protein
MIKQLLLLVTTALIFTSANAQTPLPYFTGFDNASQQDGWTQQREGDLGSYQWNYNAFSPYSVPNNLSHNYPVGGTQITDDWFVSPVFDFSNGGKIDSIRHAFSGFGVPGIADTFALYLLIGSQDPSVATTMLLKDYRDTNYVNDNVWHKTEDVTISSIPGSCYIAFRYKTINNWLDVRLDNIRVSGNATTGVHSSLNDKGILIFPNPVNDYIQIKFTEENLQNEKLSLKVFNLLGVLLLERNISENEKIKIDQPAGAYFYQVVNEKNVTRKSGKFFIQ